MAIAKTLNILLKAPTSQLDKDFKKAQGLAQGFFSKIQSMAGMLTGGLLTAGIGLTLRKAFTDLDAIAKRAVRLNVDVTELRNLDLAAEMSGMAVGSLDTAFVRLATHVTNANNGAKTSADIFKRLGIEAGMFSKMRFPEQLQVIADRFGNIEDGTEKAGLAIRMFGRSGLQLLPLLANRGQGLIAAMERAQNLGGFVSPAMAGMVETANDALSALSFTVRSLFQRIAINLAPAFTMLYNAITDAIKPGTAINEAMMTLGNTATTLLYIFSSFVKVLSFISEVTGKFGGAVISVVVSVVALNLAAKTVTATYKSLLIIQSALAKIELLRAKLNPATIAFAAAALVAYTAFSEEINSVIAKTLGFADAQAAANAELVDFNALADKAAQKQRQAVNLASAGFGSQAALEQLLTVRTDRDNAARPVVAAIEGQNGILEQMRDGINEVAGMFNAGGFNGTDL